MDEIITHLAQFLSRLWQIHIFGEGNTRTTAVFFIKYLRTLGFHATNDIFAENAQYFRNALVRANYNDLRNGIHETTEYLELFLRNLLLDENNTLSNRTMHISRKFSKKANIQDEKVNIQHKEVNIQDEKAYIDKKLSGLTNKLSNVTINHIYALYSKYSKEDYFTRIDVENLTDLKSTRAYELVKLLLQAKIIEPVKGHGKGKYRFISQ